MVGILRNELKITDWKANIENNVWLVASFSNKFPKISILRSDFKSISIRPLVTRFCSQIVVISRSVIFPKFESTNSIDWIFQTELRIVSSRQSVQYKTNQPYPDASTVLEETDEEYREEEYRIGSNSFQRNSWTVVKYWETQTR